MTKCECYPGLFFIFVPVFTLNPERYGVKEGVIAFSVYLLVVCLFSPQELKEAIASYVKLFVPVIFLYCLLCVYSGYFSKQADIDDCISDSSFLDQSV